MEFTFKAKGNVLHEVKVIDEKEIAYLTFIIYVEYIHFIVEDLESKQDLYLDNDSLYDLCYGLAVRFSGSEYDDEDVPLCQCMNNFLAVAEFDIKEKLKKMNFY